MSVLTEVSSVEMVIPVPPSTQHRTVDMVADNAWVVTGWSSQFSTALSAMHAIREEVERNAKYPVRVHIRWRGVPSGWIAPTTGGVL